MPQLDALSGAALLFSRNALLRILYNTTLRSRGIYKLRVVVAFSCSRTERMAAVRPSFLLFVYQQMLAFSANHQPR